VLAEPLKVAHGIQGSVEHCVNNSVLRLRSMASIKIMQQPESGNNRHLEFKIRVPSKSYNHTMVGILKRAYDYFIHHSLVSYSTISDTQGMNIGCWQK